MLHEFKNCRYCADEVDVSYLERHEAKCKTLSVEERERERLKRKSARDAYRKNHNLNREKYRASMAVPTVKKRVGRPPGSHNSVWANGHGKRLSATISIDFKTFRTLILQLAPSLSIDKVEVL